MDYIRYLNIHSKMILTYPSYFQLPGINENNLKICQKITLYPIQCTWPVYSDFTPQPSKEPNPLRQFPNNLPKRRMPPIRVQPILSIKSTCPALNPNPNPTHPDHNSWLLWLFTLKPFDKQFRRLHTYSTIVHQINYQLGYRKPKTYLNNWGE
ncbi:MAG: hypothetical protein C5S43_01690 [Candidatus Methanocomedens sp.]|nr:MAG: hypothetical protein C5S43_01690 [ANME-2 cluster archaeon]